MAVQWLGSSANSARDWPHQASRLSARRAAHSNAASEGAVRAAVLEEVKSTCIHMQGPFTVTTELQLLVDGRKHTVRLLWLKNDFHTACYSVRPDVYAEQTAIESVDTRLAFLRHLNLHGLFAASINGFLTAC